MARVTVEDCTNKIANKYTLTEVSARRAWQLAYGMEPSVDWDGDKPTVVALREIAAGHVDESILKEDQNMVLSKDKLDSEKTE